MDDQEKSVMLVKASNDTTKIVRLDGAWDMGSDFKFTPHEWDVAEYYHHLWRLVPNLYLPANMALARRVRIWALKDAPKMVRDTMKDYADSYWYEWMLSPDARPWLDAILETLIECELVDERIT